MKDMESQLLAYYTKHNCKAIMEKLYIIFILNHEFNITKMDLILSILNFKYF